MVLGRLLDCLMSDMCLMMRVVVMTNGTWQVACVTISDICLMMRVVVMINNTGQVACLSPCQTCAS